MIPEVDKFYAINSGTVLRSLGISHHGGYYMFQIVARNASENTWPIIYHYTLTQFRTFKEVPPPKELYGEGT